MAPGAWGVGVKSVVTVSPDKDEVSFLFIINALDIISCPAGFITQYNQLMLLSVENHDPTLQLEALLVLARGLKEVRDAHAH